MLSKIIKVSFVRAFSTSNTPALRSTATSQLFERSGLPETEVTEASRNELREIQAVVESERKHLAYYANELKEELNDQININFEVEQSKKTLIFESLPDGTNHSKLGEVLVLGSVYSLSNLLLGFPSYLALGGTLGVAGLGAVWSYSNYLKRTSPQVTEIYRTSDNQLEVHYFKPSGLFGRTLAHFTVDANNVSHASFGGSLFNYLRKSNHTSWARIDGKLYWFNSNPSSIRINNHYIQFLL